MLYSVLQFQGYIPSYKGKHLVMSRPPVDHLALAVRRKKKQVVGPVYTTLMPILCTPLSLARLFLLNIPSTASLNQLGTKYLDTWVCLRLFTFKPQNGTQDLHPILTITYMMSLHHMHCIL